MNAGMKLYMWRSRFLANWGHGYMIAVASSTEEAREKLRKEFEIYFWEEQMVSKDEPDDMERYEDDLRAVDEDLSELPEELEALFIPGSD